MSLPGGVLHRKGYAVGATGSWSVSNLHGDVIATVEDGSVTAAFVYDPFGQPLNPASGVVDTTAVPATRTGTGTTDGWAGVFQRGYEHTGGLNQTLMGARTYLPALGMFTATDPVPGGNTTTYTYPQDPINHADYAGTMLSDGPSGSTLNIPLSLPGWKPFNPQRGDSKRGTFQESRTYKIIQAAVGVYSFRTLISSIGWLGQGEADLAIQSLQEFGAGTVDSYVAAQYASSPSYQGRHREFYPPIVHATKGTVVIGFFATLVDYAMDPPNAHGPFVDQYVWVAGAGDSVSGSLIACPTCGW